MHTQAWHTAMEPELFAFYSRWVPEIQEAIRAFFPRSPDRAWLQSLAGTVVAQPWDMEAVSDAFTDPVWMYLDRGGKLLRPVLTAAVLELLGQPVRRYLPLLAAIEVMESSTIMVDDVTDESDQRRGGPTGHVAYSSPLLAINAGYGVFKHCLSLFYNNGLGLSEEQVLALLDAFAEENFLIAAGHAAEFYWTDRRISDVTESQYYQEVTNRMAFLSFRGPCRAAAVLAGADPDVVTTLSRFGLFLGLGYHLRGDLLNLQPASEAWGKDLGDDLSGGRRTLPILRTLAVAEPRDRQRLLEILDAHTRDEAWLKEGIGIIARYDAVSYVEERVGVHTANAMRDLAALPGTNAGKALLAQFLQFAALTRIN